jgi:hypothetical protein
MIPRRLRHQVGREGRQLRVAAGVAPDAPGDGVEAMAGVLEVAVAVVQACIAPRGAGVVGRDQAIDRPTAWLGVSAVAVPQVQWMVPVVSSRPWPSATRSSIGQVVPRADRRSTVRS